MLSYLPAGYPTASSSVRRARAEYTPPAATSFAPVRYVGPDQELDLSQPRDSPFQGIEINALLDPLQSQTRQDRKPPGDSPDTAPACRGMPRPLAMRSASSTRYGFLAC